MREPSWNYEQKRQRFRTTLQNLWDLTYKSLIELREKYKEKKIDLDSLLETIYGHKM